MDDVEQGLVERERRQWERLWTGKDRELEADFADGFLSVDARGLGTLTREETLAEFRSGDVAVRDYELTDFRVLRPTEDTALVLYRADGTALANGEPFPWHAFSTALWVRRDGRWEKAFYQSTPVREARQG